MRYFRTLTALMLVALWIPVSMHCLLERVSGFALFQCAGEKSAPAPSTHCEDDGCALIESGDYTAKHHEIMLDPCLCLRCVPTVLDLEPASPPLARENAASGPGEFLQTWQFSARAALPPRAPSFIA